MTRIVMTADQTNMTEFRRVPLLDFFGCAPAERVPGVLYDFFAKPVPHVNGVAVYAPYGTRKVEAALTRCYKRDDVVFAHPYHIENFIDEGTTIVGVSVMDPLGLGPVSMMFTYGGFFTSYTKKRFLAHVKKIERLRRAKDLKFKIVVGGTGAWQLELKDETRKELNIDHLVVGEIDHIAPEIFQSIEGEKAPETIRVNGFPKMSQIPLIEKPSVHGVVEVMRGCGRNCDFCEPNLRAARYCDVDRVVEEVQVNIRGGQARVWAQSEDIFLYKLEDHRRFMPNTDALCELFRGIMSVRGVGHSNPTHGSVAPAAADPDMMRKLSRILRAGPGNWIGIQPGMETGSPRIIKTYMENKCKPFSPYEWPQVVFEGTKTFNENYWFPAYTLIIGLPGETRDDTLDTLRLIDLLERELPNRLGGRAHFSATPLSFVPVGTMRKEGFFRVDQMISEENFLLIYKCWRHILKEFMTTPHILNHIAPALRPFVGLLMRVGISLALRILEDYGRKRGFDHEKALHLSPMALSKG